MEMALGFMMTRRVALKEPKPSHAVSASARIRLQHVLPPPVGPTSIRPCRTLVVSYSWMHLEVKASTGCRRLARLRAQMLSMSAP